jgi:hypothetical protein
VRELAGGLWTWSAPHPDWTEGEDWGPDVRSYALQTDTGMLLFDPIAPPAEFTSRGEVEVVLTADWHSRDVATLGAPIRRDDLPKDVNAQPCFYPGERSLWIPAHSALIVGDSLPDGKAMPDRWLGGSSRDEYKAKLKPLLDLPVELLLPTHGDPVLEDARDALVNALS